MLAVLVVFYLIRGMVKIERGRSGRTVVRFNAFERFVHWMTATCFIILALSGLNITFGKLLLRRCFGLEAFATWSQWAKYAHNYLSFPFTIGVVLILLMWIAGNIPNRADMEWVKRGGGIVGKDHPPAYALQRRPEDDLLDRHPRRHRLRDYRLHADVPVLRHRHGGNADRADHPRRGRRAVHRRHAGHIYIGTIGMEGAFEAMGEGTSTRTGRSSTTRCGWRRRSARLPPAQRRAGLPPNSLGLYLTKCGARRKPPGVLLCYPSPRSGGGSAITPAMRIIGLAGWSGSGKTTLITKAVPCLIARGNRVSTLKHAHHGFDLDQPGKDSFMHRAAGATEVVISSAKRFAILHELRDEPEWDLPDLLNKLSPVDLVLVEGFKRDAFPKLEIHRVDERQAAVASRRPAHRRDRVRPAAAAGQGAGDRPQRHRAHLRPAARARRRRCSMARTAAMRSA